MNPAHVRCATAAALVVSALLLRAGAVPPEPPPPAPAPADAYRHVRVFDFNERPLGNYEELPMHWRKLTGPGLPAYSSGRLDDTVGHRAPPAFLFTLRGGSICYEYVGEPLTLQPGCDFVVEGAIRTAGLEHAAACMACYQVDAEGAPLPGTERVSERVRSGGAGPEWRRIHIPLRVDGAAARAVRLQLWVVQDYVLGDAGARAPDPITQQDVEARVWFDDVALVRTPRLRMTFSSAAHVVPAASRASVELETHNATLGPLHCELVVRDAAGEIVWRTARELAAQATDAWREALPDLPGGRYSAEARLQGAAETLASEALHFAVLPDLPESGKGGQFGVDVPGWAQGDAAALAELVAALGCTSARLRVPVPAAASSAGEPLVAQLRTVSRALFDRGIETIGVLAPPGKPGADGASLAEWTRTCADWAVSTGALLIHAGPSVRAWQLGGESAGSAASGSWTPELIQDFAQRLQRITSLPALIVPRSILDAAASPQALHSALELDAADEPLRETAPFHSEALVVPGRCTNCFWIPPGVPARALPWQLASWLARDGAPAPHPGPVWLSIGQPPTDAPDSAARLADLARRVVLAAAVNPERIYLPGAFARCDDGGARWQPLAEYIPLRTLVQALSGYRAIAALGRQSDVAGLLFAGRGGHLLVAWTWEHTPPDRVVEWYLGPRAVAWDVHGAPVALTQREQRTRVPLAAVPRFISNIAAGVLLVDDRLEIAPDFIDLADGAPAPVLRLSNPLTERELAGTIELGGPDDWGLEPARIAFRLAPGAALAETLRIGLPQRELAGTQEIRVRVRLTQPDAGEVQLTIPLHVGLRGVALQTAAYWEEADLLVEQRFQNHSERPVSFDAFCQVSGRPRMEGAFLDVPPGETRIQLYRLPAARALSGSQLWVGVAEIGGRRRLEQLVAVPQ